MTAEIIPERIRIKARGHELEGLEYSPKHPALGQVLLVQGRNEMLFKYADFCSTLCETGLKVTTYDHIGQGFSPRITANPEMCHIDSFDTYAQDLEKVIETLDEKLPLTVIAISMGGLITMKALQNANIRSRIGKLVFVSPFLGIKQPIPLFLIKTLSYLREVLSGQFTGKKPCFFYFNDVFRKKTVGLDANTHDRKRNADYYRLYDTYPEARLGGLTTSWLRAAVTCLKSVWSYEYDFTVPCLFLIAEKDNMVSSDAIKKFTAKQAKKCTVIPKIIEIKNSLHDILIEEDQYRTPAVEAVLKFLE